MAGVSYLLVFPAVRDKEVVPHLHGEVQPGEGMTHFHPQRRGIAGHSCHGSHFSTATGPLLHPMSKEVMRMYERRWSCALTDVKGKSCKKRG